VRSEGNGKCIWHNDRIEEMRERVLVYVFSIMLERRGEERVLVMYLA
jgi:hypothetical protein